MKIEMTPDKQCGCTVALRIGFGEDGKTQEGVAEINYCPLHKAAKDMLDVLKEHEVIDRYEPFLRHLERKFMKRAIAKATGET